MSKPFFSHSASPLQLHEALLLIGSELVNLFVGISCINTALTKQVTAY